MESFGKETQEFIEKTIQKLKKWLESLPSDCDEHFDNGEMWDGGKWVKNKMLDGEKWKYLENQSEKDKTISNQIAEALEGFADALEKYIEITEEISKYENDKSKKDRLNDSHNLY